MAGADLRNLEGAHEFDIVWPWRRGNLRPGATAVVRVKNEARSLPFVLPGLLRAFDEVLVVDNGSTDDTVAVARAAAEQAGLADRLRQASYPFDVARAGAEHLGTPATSVHSLVYFYNWCFAQVSTRYSWKWDGDMVLTPEAELVLGSLAWKIGDTDTVVRVPRHGLFIADEQTAYLDLGWRNMEEWGFPVGPEYLFVKSFEWELRMTPGHARTLWLPQGLVVELKWLDGDEFAHWSDPESFATSQRNQRKRREWAVFHGLRQGAVPDGVVEIVAPAGVHVVDHVTRTWLPQVPRPLRVGSGAS